MNATTHRQEIDRTRQAAWLLTGLGIVHVPLIAFHFAFPALFGWGEELPRMSNDNAGLLLCFHVCAIFWLGSMGAASLVDGIQHLRGREGIAPRGFWLWMAGFYLYRAAVEIPTFGFHPESLATMALLLPFTAAYVVAWKKLGPEIFETRGFVGARLRPESWLR